MTGPDRTKSRPGGAIRCIRETDLRGAGRDRFAGPAKRAIETGRNRAAIAAAVFALGFLAVAGRLVDVAVSRAGGEPRQLAASKEAAAPISARGNIVDRNGVVLATNLKAAALVADPRRVINAESAAARLASLLPEFDQAEAARRLASDRHFVWLRRGLTPRQQMLVNRLGIPGLYFQQDERRVYPHGRIASHVLGHTGFDNQGLGGVESFFDRRLSGVGGVGRDVTLSLDIRVQHILHEELMTAVAEQQAIGGSALVMDVRNGEILAMVSLPDFDPNQGAGSSEAARFNRNSLGVYEMGSTFKIFTTAMALEYGAAKLDDLYDVARPIRVARHTINDLHGSGRPLTVSDIFVKSSNIGAVHLAMAVGTAGQRSFLGRLGLFDKPAIELSEIGAPLQPAKWREINTMTVAFGHGVAVSPVQHASAIAAVANGGILYPPTLVKRAGNGQALGRRVISPVTSAKMRELMRRVVVKGTGRRAAVEEFEIGGKTGTAEKPSKRGYQRRKLLSSFVGLFPIYDPRYLVFVLIDEPKGVDGNSRRATGGWVAAPVVGAVVRRSGLLLGVLPTVPVEETVDETERPIIKVNAGGIALAAR